MAAIGALRAHGSGNKEWPVDLDAALNKRRGQIGRSKRQASVGGNTGAHETKAREGKQEAGREREGRRQRAMATVIEPLPNAMFRWSWKTSTRCWPISGKMPKILFVFCREIGVAVGLSPYDLTRGRIVYRYK